MAMFVYRSVRQEIKNQKDQQSSFLRFRPVTTHPIYWVVVEPTHLEQYAHVPIGLSFFKDPCEN